MPRDPTVHGCMQLELQFSNIFLKKMSGSVGNKHMVFICIGGIAALCLHLYTRMCMSSVCIRIYICICIHIRVRIRIYIGIDICVLVYVYVYMYMC
jgi:hypothetical protein